MPVPYNFNNNPLNAKRKQSWFARYRVVVVFGAVALVTLIIVLCITNCSSGGDDKGGAENNSAPAAAGEDNRSEENSVGTTGSDHSTGKTDTAAQPQQDSTEWVKNEIKYIVKSGDMLRHIVRRHHASERGVVKLNALSNPNAIRIGQKLRIIPGPWRLTIDRTKNSMTIFQNDKIYMRCPALCKALPGEYSMVWRQQAFDSKNRKKGTFYLMLRNKKTRKLYSLELRNNDIQQLLYLLPGGIQAAVTGNK